MTAGMALPPPSVPGRLDGEGSIEWLARHPGARGVDERWFFAAVGATLALADTTMADDLGRRLRRSAGPYVTGVVAWAAASVDDTSMIPSRVRDWLLGHQRDVARSSRASATPFTHPAPTPR